MRKILICITTFMLFLSVGVQAQPEGDFLYYDTLTYRLYEQGDWKTLAKSGKIAMAAGFDYYYLRMRTGIALFELGKYFPAIKHFEQARTMNPLSHDPLIYLYYCYAGTGRWLRAHEILHELPASALGELTPIPANAFYVESGPESGNANEKVPEDLDGPQNIFGETFLPDRHLYSSLGYEHFGNRRVSLHLNAIYIHGERIHRATTSSNTMLYEKFPIDQWEGYFSARLNLGKGFYLRPAYHFIRLQYDYTAVLFDPWTGSSRFMPMNEQYADHLFLLGFEKEAGRVMFSLTGAYSDLFLEKQYQGTAGLTWYPMGNTRLWFGSRLINHTNAGRDSWIFSQEIGFRTAKILWFEFRATVGEMENYHENYGYVVYNTGYTSNFIGESRLFINLGKSFIFMVNYRASQGDASWVNYRFRPGPMRLEQVTGTTGFWNHFISGGLTWNF